MSLDSEQPTDTEIEADVRPRRVVLEERITAGVTVRSWPAKGGGYIQDYFIQASVGPAGSILLTYKAGGPERVTEFQVAISPEASEAAAEAGANYRAAEQAVERRRDALIRRHNINTLVNDAKQRGSPDANIVALQQMLDDYDRMLSETEE